ncbi:arginine--tRNA ligase [Candidatus Nomurabacteria bacterium RIFCSPLOWO2_01_FULL_41_12]|uniref:Arginine--tRNA ligase n=1 Tax=Candidatus Nomurabacteria bacterium RIFCSPLOWO2_01_FULL_41_12 TaxID=1801774 RepID=A0A1F6WW04_9BACT|nr:MAG: arginine--tRNA ligase [Candidatus Nomurabacteria bacterium RIFCSPLOWO2_01_FULL_41_12]
MQDKIKKLIRNALENLNVEVTEISLEHPGDLKMGDYSTNIAMVCAKALQANPKELAGKIVAEILRLNTDKYIEKIEASGGFINFFLSRKFFSQSIEEILNKGENVGANAVLSGKKIMIEYTDPNPFKPLHIGHLMTNAIGESIARILEHSGATVSRANYQGDVGLHVAKAVYILLENFEEYVLKNESIKDQAFFIGQAYSQGAEEYKSNEKAKEKIEEINKKIYDRSDEEINKIYDWGFKVTMEAFEDIYKMLGTKFDFYFLESQIAPFGQKIVEDNLGKIFKESEGAIVFKGEEYDRKLHTRVFITSAGLPMYETKELGLTVEKFNTEPNLDLSIVITANEQMNYMKVVAKALSLIYPEYAVKMRHITHGMMRFSRNLSGKMSSRTGLIITAEDLIRQLKEKTGSEEIAVGAIKHMILRQAIGGDIIFDLEKSVSTEGDSGVYLQYAHARANSVIEKAKKENILPDPDILMTEIFEVEKLLYRFPEIVFRSAKAYQPHHIANYLIELARSFNSFYGNTVIVNKEDPTSAYKVSLTFAFALVMKKGLYLLGIKAPEKM